MTDMKEKLANLKVDELKDFYEWVRRQPHGKYQTAIGLFEEYDGLVHSVPVWVEHNGLKCPLGMEVLHRRKYRDGISRDVTNGRNAGDHHWSWAGKEEQNADILGYQVFENRRHFHYIKELEETGAIKFGE